MSSRRSRGRAQGERRLRQQVRHGQLPADPLDLLEQNLKETSPDTEVKLVRNRPGQEKMSAVLLEFLAPYLASVDTRLAFESLIGLGVLAWNGAMLPPDEWEKMCQTALQGMPLGQHLHTKMLLLALLERKQSLFADNRRLMVSYVVTEDDAQWHVSVASTESEPERKTAI